MPSTKRRRAKRKPQSGELFQIVEGDTVLVEEKLPSEGAMLSKAQNLLVALNLNKKLDEPVKYVVRLVPVFGPPDDLYEVVLHPSGVVHTYPAGALR